MIKIAKEKTMKPRLVLYGHGAHHTHDGDCTIPEGTTITFYGPHGAILDKNVSSALADGEIITTDDLTYVKDEIYYLKKEISVVNRVDESKLEKFPKTYGPGEKVPNYFLNPAPHSFTNNTPVNRVKIEVGLVEEMWLLSDILVDLKGEDIHWAACRTAKTPDKNSPGHGYAVKFSANSKLKSIYFSPEKSESEKLKSRAERFGLDSKNSPSDTKQDFFNQRQRRHEGIAGQSNSVEIHTYDAVRNSRNNRYTPFS